MLEFNDESGMSLLEVLIAIAILGLVAIAFLTALGTGFLGVTLADERTVAESLARSQLEAIRNAEYEYYYDPRRPYYKDVKIDAPPGYEIIITITPVPHGIELPGFTPFDMGLQKITVEVKHKKRLVLRVETYKASREFHVPH